MVAADSSQPEKFGKIQEKMPRAGEVGKMPSVNDAYADRVLYFTKTPFFASPAASETLAAVDIPGPKEYQKIHKF